MSTLDTLLGIAETDSGAIPPATRDLARLSLFDWMVCGLAAVDEPVARGVRRVVEGEGGREVAHLFGGGRAPVRAAALLNGATSHALDFDDTHFAHIGHLSVGIYPAALAAGEEVGASAADAVDAFLLGAEAAIRVGLRLGRAHYDRGFHQTSTAGAFGATVAAARLYGLDRDGTRRALGLCATRASGLKSQFGTMGKPLNAGLSAANGIECAQLARAGLTSADDGLDGPQGFVDTHSDDPAFDVPNAGHYLFDDIKFKLHACCHGTHAMIEALRAARGDRGLSAEDVAALTVRTHPRWLSVCNIELPRTGLEGKFSYKWIAGMVLDGRETADEGTFSDDCTSDDTLRRFASGVTVAGDESLTDMEAVCILETRDGEQMTTHFDLAARIAPETLAQALRRKAKVCLGNTRADALWNGVSDNAKTARDLGRLMAGH